MSILAKSSKLANENAWNARLHISVNVSDLKQSIAFYRELFGVEPIKVKYDYAKFAMVKPAINLTLNVFPDNIKTEGHFGVQFLDRAEVFSKLARLKKIGFQVVVEEVVDCCYAEQSKFWMSDPDGNRWEIFVNTDDDVLEGCGADCICHQDLERTFLVN